MTQLGLFTAKLSPAAARVLGRLTQGPATNFELVQPGCGGIRFGARIFELRERGHRIETVKETATRCVYKLQE